MQFVFLKDLYDLSLRRPFYLISDLFESHFRVLLKARPLCPLCFTLEIPCLGQFFPQSLDLLPEGVEVFSDILIDLHLHLEALSTLGEHQGGESITQEELIGVNVGEEFGEGIAS